jgi:hypothetical protein
MNKQDRIFGELKDVLLKNAPNLIANAKRQLEKNKQTDDQTTYHVAMHSIFLPSERLNKLTRLLTRITILLAILTAVNIALLAFQIWGRS